MVTFRLPTQQHPGKLTRWTPPPPPALDPALEPKANPARESLPSDGKEDLANMAGELPVDLSTWRKGGSQGRCVSPDREVSLDASGRQLPTSREPEEAPSAVCQPGPILPGMRSTASPQAGLEGEKKAKTCLPLRKRPYVVPGAGGGAQGPLAGKVPKTESSELWGSPFNGYHSPYISVSYPRFPAVYYSGLAGPFISPEMSPLLHPVTPNPVLRVPTPYSFLCPMEAQLALDVATATKQDEDGDTPLHIAVVQGNLLAARRLIALFHQGRQSLDTFNNLRQTPLHLAVITAQPTLVKLLLSHGASPMVLDRNGQTALHLACEHDSIHCLQELLDGSPGPLDLEARNFEGFTPLHVAVGTQNRDIILTLLEHGADVDAVDIKSGRSPLLHAVENDNLEMVELLLQHRANVNAQSYGGNTALHAACGRGLLETLRLLVRNGADGSLKNYHNDTPLMVAKNKRVIDILRGKTSRPGPPPENIREGSSPATSNASSPGIRPVHTGLLRASPDSCPTTPSPAQTPKPHRAVQSPNSANQKPESTASTNGPLTHGTLSGVKLERSPTPPTPEQPMGFPGMPKFFLPVAESLVDPAFHTTLYPFASSSHNYSPHHLCLLPAGMQHSVISLPAAPQANRIHPRGTEVDQSQTLLDSETPPAADLKGQWPKSRDSGPGGS
ncbi:B-cell lymphoma 3 protein [Lacerta agilis]|uniref:B-cell lymphoma 3 protein n=1 Tax=Lacerta agilis TaxID=80427 RepID=UPI00141A3D28|nr:B-cell lymphoma 3 protein [Lacerta agilis]